MCARARARSARLSLQGQARVPRQLDELRTRTFLPTIPLSFPPSPPHPFSLSHSLSFSLGVVVVAAHCQGRPKVSTGLFDSSADLTFSPFFLLLLLLLLYLSFFFNLITNRIFWDAKILRVLFSFAITPIPRRRSFPFFLFISLLYLTSSARIEAIYYLFIRKKKDFVTGISICSNMQILLLRFAKYYLDFNLCVTDFPFITDRC